MKNLPFQCSNPGCKAHLYVSTNQVGKPIKLECPLCRASRVVRITNNENMAVDDSIDDDILNDETLEELAEALEKLPTQLREIIVLRYYDGMPLTEIAKKMSLSYGAMKLRHAKALEMIRKSMP